jgi:hypothetical protein
VTAIQLKQIDSLGEKIYNLKDRKDSEVKQMKPLSADTQLQAERVHIELIRKAPLSLRLQMVNSLIGTTRQLSWRGICERYSQETLESRLRRFVLLLYGDKSLADRVVTLMMEKGICPSFVSPEDTILHKLASYKAGEEISDRQWNDVQGVLKVQGDQLDMAYLNRWAKELSVSELLKKAIDEAGI